MTNGAAGRDEARAGAGRVELGVADVLPFDGFDGVLDPIFVRALVVEAGQRCCIVSVETTSLRGDLANELRDVASAAASCEREATWVTPTHTFSVPHVRTPEHLATDDERSRNALLRDMLVTAVEKAVGDAVDALGPVTLGYSRGLTSTNVNRDVETPAGWWLGLNPAGYSDHGLRALVVRREGDGAAVAVVFSADVQSSVLMGSRDGMGRRLVTGDLAGRASSCVEAALPGCVALFLVGAAGDQAPASQAVTTSVDADGGLVREDAGDAGIGLLAQLGTTLGEEVLSAMSCAEPLACERVSAHETIVSCLGQVRADFASLRPTREYAYVPAPDVITTVGALRLGDLVLIGVPPEIPSSLGTLVRSDEAAPHVDILTLVNGGQKYLPADDAYERCTYEAMNSSFGKGSAELLLRAATNAVRDVYELGDSQ